MKHRIIQGECLKVMCGMLDNSIDAVITDPPYFKFKGESWDRQWDTATEFLEWYGLLCEQWHRILKPNGSLYVFASSRMAARVEVETSRRFNVLNHLVWNKAGLFTGGIHRRVCKEELRSFFPASERIIFAEHYGADNIAKGEAGYNAKCDELRGFVFEPLRAYLAGEFERAGMLNQEGKIKANVACGFSASSGGMASRHYFSQSQWQLPTPEHYKALRDLLNATGGDYLRREYEDLRREYEDLRREYEDLRRPFQVTEQEQYTDVWEFATVQAYPDKHPCEKPVDLMRHMIKCSTRSDAVVLDPFAGSGSTGVACVHLDRDFIGIELDPKYCEIAHARIRDAQEENALVDLMEAQP